MFDSLRRLSPAWWDACFSFLSDLRLEVWTKERILMRKIKTVSHYGKSWTCGSAATVTAGEELVACLIWV